MTMVGLKNQGLELVFKYISRSDLKVIRYMIDSNLVNVHDIYLLLRGRNEDDNEVDKDSDTESDFDVGIDNDGSGGHGDESGMMRRSIIMVTRLMIQPLELVAMMVSKKNLILNYLKSYIKNVWLLCWVATNLFNV